MGQLGGLFLAWARPVVSAGLAHVSGQLAGQLAVDDLELPQFHAWQWAGSWDNWVLLHEASYAPTGWPGLLHMVALGFQVQQERTCSVCFSSL